MFKLTFQSKFHSSIENFDVSYSGTLCSIWPASNYECFFLPQVNETMGKIKQCKNAIVTVNFHQFDSNHGKNIIENFYMGNKIIHCISLSSSIAMNGI